MIFTVNEYDLIAMYKIVYTTISIIGSDKQPLSSKAVKFYLALASIVESEYSSISAYFSLLPSLRDKPSRLG